MWRMWCEIIMKLSLVNPWDERLTEDNRLLNAKSSYSSILMAPPCRLTFQNHTFTRLMDYNNGFSLSPFFLSLHSFLWIGSQFPQEKFLSYGRILTLYYYFLLMCILFSQDYYYIYFYLLKRRTIWKKFIFKTPKDYILHIIL